MSVIENNPDQLVVLSKLHELQHSPVTFWTISCFYFKMENPILYLKIPKYFSGAIIWFSISCVQFFHVQEKKPIFASWSFRMILLSSITVMSQSDWLIFVSTPDLWQLEDPPSFLFMTWTNRDLGRTRLSRLLAIFFLTRCFQKSAQCLR